MRLSGPGVEPGVDACKTCAQPANVTLWSYVLVHCFYGRVKFIANLLLCPKLKQDRFWKFCHIAGIRKIKNGFFQKRLSGSLLSFLSTLTGSMDSRDNAHTRRAEGLPGI